MYMICKHLQCSQKLIEYQLSLPLVVYPSAMVSQNIIYEQGRINHSGALYQHKAGAPFPSLPFPSSPFPFPSFPSPPFHSASLLFPPLRSKPLNSRSGVWGLSWNRFWCILVFKSDIWWQHYLWFSWESTAQIPPLTSRLGGLGSVVTFSCEMWTTNSLYSLQSAVMLKILINYCVCVCNVDRVGQLA